MAGLRPWAVLMGAVALLCGCGQSGGGGAASSQAAASSAPVSAAPSDTAVSTAAASDLPPVAAASSAAVATVTPAAAPAEPRREPAAAELLRDDPGYTAKERKLDALYENAKERDPTGQVEREQASALAQRRACGDKACLDAWFRRREAALRRYVEE